MFTVYVNKDENTVLIPAKVLDKFFMEIVSLFNNVLLSHAPNNSFWVSGVYALALGNHLEENNFYPELNFEVVYRNVYEDEN